MAGRRRKPSAAGSDAGADTLAVPVLASALIAAVVVAVSSVVAGALPVARSGGGVSHLGAADLTVPESRAPTGGLPGWRQVFVEDFDRPVHLGGFMTDTYYRSRFARTYPSPWKDTSGHGRYDPGRTLSVADGVLDIRLHTRGGVPRVAAVEPTLDLPSRGQTYGRYLVRFRADVLPGYKIAWLLWPDSGLRSEGEIDFPEAVLDAKIKAFVHQASNDGSPRSIGLQDEFGSTTRPTEWHTATIEWRPGRVRFLLDGEVLGTSTERVPTRPMHWVLQTETRLSGPAPAPSVSGHVQVDYVAAWAYDP